MPTMKSLLQIGTNCSRLMNRCAPGCVRWVGDGRRQAATRLSTNPAGVVSPFFATGSVAAREISCTARASHGNHEEGFEDAPSVELVWETAKGEMKKTEAKCGMNLMRVAHAHGIELEGACEGVCACSTCHVVLSEEVFDSLPEASEEEEDMLDMAFGLTETSRLGCQVIVTEDMEGVVVKLPAATRNFYVDGHVPQPH